MKSLVQDIKHFYDDCRAQDFGFYMVVAYLVFSYLRPQQIYPVLDVLPWAQLSIVAGLGYAAMKGQLRFQSTHFVLVLFFLVCLLSSYNSLYPEASFGRINVVYIWIIEVFFFTSCIKNLKQFYLIAIVFFVVLFKISFFGARTWVQRGFGFTGYGIAGPHGFFENSGELSLLMAMLSVMSIAFLVGNKKTRKIYYLLPITSIMTVLAASSRGGQLALIVGLLIIVVTIGKLRIKNLVYIILVGWLIFNLIPEQQKERFSTAGEDKTSTSRLLYWEKGIEMLHEYPWLGVGYNSFPRYFEEHYSYTLPEFAPIEVAHNTFIEVSSTLGYIGLIVYLWLCWLIFLLNRQARKIIFLNKEVSNTGWVYQFSRGLDAAMIAYFIGSFFMSVAFYPYLYFMLMFSQSMKNATLSEIEEMKRNK